MRVLKFLQLFQKHFIPHSRCFAKVYRSVVSVIPTTCTPFEELIGRSNFGKFARYIISTPSDRDGGFPSSFIVSSSSLNTGWQAKSLPDLSIIRKPYSSGSLSYIKWRSNKV